MVYPILAGIAAGLTYSLTSWGKKKDQPFDSFKFSVTLVLGVLAGVVTFLYTVPVEQAYVMCLAGVPIIENILKVIWRKFLH